MSVGRLREAQSRTNWVRRSWAGLRRSLFEGKCWAIVLNKFGITLFLVSAVPLHRVSRCARSSAGLDDYARNFPHLYQ